MNAAERYHVQRVALLPCCVCKRFVATNENCGRKLDIHHVAEGSGLRSWFSIARLCEEHHVGSLGFHTRGRGFIMQYRPPGEREEGLLVWTNEDLAELDRKGQSLAKVAQRYEKIKNKYSPFAVRDFRQAGLYVLSPDLDVALDEWQPASGEEDG